MVQKQGDSGAYDAGFAGQIGGIAGPRSGGIPLRNLESEGNVGPMIQVNIYLSCKYLLPDICSKCIVTPCNYVPILSA